MAGCVEDGQSCPSDREFTRVPASGGVLSGGRTGLSVLHEPRLFLWLYPLRDLGAGGAQGGPGADVAPAEVAADGDDIGGLLHQGVVDGDVRHRRVRLVGHGGDFGGGGGELALEEAGPPEEHAGVPGVVAGPQELLGALARRLLGEADELAEV